MRGSRNATDQGFLAVNRQRARRSFAAENQRGVVPAAHRYESAARCCRRFVCRGSVRLRSNTPFRARPIASAAMSPVAIALLVFACTLGTAFVGMFLHARLPDRHLAAESQDVVKLVMGLIATMAALVLGLLIASANTAHDAQINELKTASANVVLLDRTLEFYGVRAKSARDALRDVVRETHDRVWVSGDVRIETLNSMRTQDAGKNAMGLIMRLSPKNELQKTMKTRAIDQTQNIMRSRILMLERLGSPISWPFLVVLIFWISVLFLGFGLLVRFNATVMVALAVGALSVAAAMLLILELGDPYRGFMRISDKPVLDALAQIDR